MCKEICLMFTIVKNKRKFDNHLPEGLSKKRKKNLQELQIFLKFFIHKNKYLIN